MNSHQRIRSYLEKHNVGTMFEELMTKLVTEMPPDPVAFLVRLLQQKMASGNSQTVMSVAHLRNGVGDLTSALEIVRLKVHCKPMSASSIKSRPGSLKGLQSAHRKAVTLHFPEERLQLRSAQLRPVRSELPDMTKRLPRPMKPPTFPVITKVVSPKANRRCRALCVENFKENRIRLQDFEIFDPFADETVVSCTMNDGARIEKLPNCNRPVQNEIGVGETWKSKFVARSADSVVEMYEDPCIMAEECVPRGSANKGLRVGGKMNRDGARVDVSICLRCAKIMKLNNNAEDDSSGSEDKIDSASQIDAPKMPHWTDESGASTEAGTTNNSPRYAVTQHHKWLSAPVGEIKGSGFSQSDELFLNSYHRIPVSPKRQMRQPLSPNLFLREASEEDEELYSTKVIDRHMPTVRVWEVFSDTDCKA